MSAETRIAPELGDAATTWSLSDRYRSLFDHAPVAIWEKDWSAVKPVIEELQRRHVVDFERYFADRPQLVQGLALDVEVLDFNTAAVSMYGAPDAASTRRMLQTTATKSGQRAFRATLAALARGNTRFVVEEWDQRYDGSAILVRDTVFIPEEFHASWLRVMHTTEDITERSRAERALRESEQRLQDLYDNAPDMYFTIAADGTVLSVNKFGAEYLGYRCQDLVGRAFWQVVHDDEVDRVRERLQSIFVDNRAHSEFEFRKRRRDGSVLWVHGRLRLDSTGIDARAELKMICRDITQAHVLAQKLSHQASHDALTGLVNRREFESRLKRVLDTTRSSATEHALCYLDLDQFKIINDTCGHLAGDELLRQITTELKRCIRKRDTLARLGGDEFGVLMEHCSLQQARRVAESLRAVVEDFRFRWEDKAFSLGVSVGLVPISIDSDSLSSVLRAADAACYAAKDEGRNRVHVYRPDDAQISRRFGEMQWIARLTRAMEQDRLALYWQRIVPVDANAPVQTPLPLMPPDSSPPRPKEPAGERYELLLRLIDEDGRVVLPRAYLPAAERYNVAARLDRWVVRNAFEWLQKNPEFVARLGLCSINLSGQTLGDDEFPQYVIDRFRATNTPAAKICFEISESSATANLTGATRAVRTLKEWGCRFALDDFGSGLSSFAYLKSLDVDYLKIDGMFVKDIVDDPIDLAMVRSINDICHVMGKQTIAEFVENDAILRVLSEIGVDYAQGFGIDEPKPIGECD